MIKNRRMVDLLENSLARASVVDYQRNLRISEALYRHACLLGVMPVKDPLDGIDSDIELARIINVRKPA